MPSAAYLTRERAGPTPPPGRAQELNVTFLTQKSQCVFFLSLVHAKKVEKV